MRTLTLALALTCSVFLVACGGSSGLSSSAAPSNGAPSTPGVPMTMTMGDDPPSGVAVVFFEALITAASLQPSDTTKPAVNVLSTPVEVEFSHLQTDVAFLSLASVPPDTYKSISLTFGNAALTIENHSGAVFGSCANNSACLLAPNFNPSTATVSAAPLPITITPKSVVSLRLDFDVNSSVQPGLSINPTVTLKTLVQRDESEGDKEVEEVDEVDGQVTAIGTNQFTLMNEQSGQSFTITTNSSTVFQGFDDGACTANPEDLTSVKQGQILDVDLSATGMGATVAKRVEFEEGANRQAIKGIITSVDSATQFHMVVFNEQPTLAGVAEGSPVAVTIQPSAAFPVAPEELGEDGGFDDTGLAFTSATNLLVGQNVQIRPASSSTTGGVTTITTGLVCLWPSQITGTVGSVDTTKGTFTLTGLSPLFTGATPPVTTITVKTLFGWRFMDPDDSDSGLPAMGKIVSVRGLLFNTPGTPTLVTRTLEMHDSD
jgi:hypothetical protein